MYAIEGKRSSWSKTNDSSIITYLTLTHSHSLQNQILIPSPLHILTAHSIPRSRTIIPRNTPLLLTRDILIHARHPRIHLIRQQALSTLVHMFRPFDDFVFSGDEVGNGFLGIVGVAGLEK